MEPSIIPMLGRPAYIFLAWIHTKIPFRKSKLRKPQEVALGPQYSGSRISRKEFLENDSDDDIYMGDSDGHSDVEGNFADPEAPDFEIDDEDGEIDSDEALGDSDEEKFKDFTFRGSSKPKSSSGARQRRPTAADFMTDSEDEGEDPRELDDISGIREQSLGDDDDDESSANSDDEGSEEDQSMTDDEESGSESDSDAAETETSKRAELKKMMSEEQKSVVATISQAAKADADKGAAVKQQRKTFDSFLNVRIRLQKALVATNSMVALDGAEDDQTAPYQAAEEAAIKLWNTLDGMRHQLAKSDDSYKSGDKRKRGIDVNTSSQMIWEQMENLETASTDIRKATLEKWSTKLNRTAAAPIASKLRNTTTQQTIIDVLEDQLSNTDRLVKRTKMPRSCAPVQVKQKVTEDPNIFDDADFYQLLLKELVDQRMMDSSAAGRVDGARPTQWTAVKEAKTKKHVDTKASKGRKMRFTVHEKIQNFMAPEDRAHWESDAVDRFFSTLLGQKNTLGEEDADASEEDEDDKLVGDEGLILFRS